MNLRKRQISKSVARRFLLAYHGLWPPRTLEGQKGILAYLRRVGSVQFDPIDVVGRNPDLVFQSRVHDYRSSMLNELLYGSRQLLESWDKQASVYLAEDWPYFAPQRQTEEQIWKPDSATARLSGRILNHIRAEGPLSALELQSRAQTDRRNDVHRALRALYRMGRLGIHHRVGSRRYFDLMERLLPAILLRAPAPHKDMQAYHDWHVLRRVGSMGLAMPNAGVHWSGIIGARARERRGALLRLVKRGLLIPVQVKGVERWTFYMKATDIPLLERIQREPPPDPQAAFLAPLDNLLWNRTMIAILFDFAYVWEVYVPKNRRRYGYYTLPVLYGEHFVARVDFLFDKKARCLKVNRWWWEPGVQRTANMRSALEDCVEKFAAYLDAHDIEYLVRFSGPER